MIDIENDVFSAVAEPLRLQFPKIMIYGEDVSLPSRFPCVTLTEADNSAYSSTQDSASLENHAVLMYEANVYSNKASGKKAECKKIQSAIDKELTRLGFTRISKISLSSDDAKIYRIVSRYSGVVSKNKEIYRR